MSYLRCLSDGVERARRKQYGEDLAAIEAELIPCQRHSERFSFQVFLDYLRLPLQDCTWQRLGSSLKHWHCKADDVVPLWHHLNAINAVKLPLKRNWNSPQVKLRPEALDCITALPSPQWAHLLPYSEHWIVGLIIWLREAGALSSDFVEAERFKMRFLNQVPLPIYLGKRLEVERGAFVLFPVKQCLWRLCLLLRDYLETLALTKGGRAMVSFNPQKWLQENWKQEVRIKGCEYQERYPGDYDEKHLSIQPYGEEVQSAFTPELEAAGKAVHNEKTNIYQFHFLVVKTVEDRPTKIMRTVYTDKEGVGEIFQEIIFGRKYINEGTAKEDRYNNKQSRKIPHPTRSVFLAEPQLPTQPTEADIAKINEFEAGIAKHNELAGKYTSEESKSSKSKDKGRLDIGPTMYVPFDIIVAVAVAWKTVHRLCYLEGYYLDHNMTELMQLADYFLRLVQCQKASDVFEVQQPPAFEEPKLSLPEGRTFESLNHTKRQRTPRHDMTACFARRTDPAIGGDYSGLGINVERHQDPRDIDGERTPDSLSQSEYYKTPPGDEDVWTRSSSHNYRIVGDSEASSWTAEEDRLTPSSYRGSDVSGWGGIEQCPNHHADKAKTIDKLQRHLALKCLEMQEKFFQMEDDLGLFEALNQQRINAVVGEDDGEIGRLWTELIKTSREPACNYQCCFDELRRLEAMQKDRESAQAGVADRLAIAKKTVIGKWMDETTDADPPLQLEEQLQSDAATIGCGEPESDAASV